MTDNSSEVLVPPFHAFVSYARADDPSFRDALVKGLVGAGLRIWFDRDSLPNRGTTFDQEIRRAIESSQRLLLVVGPEALDSKYVAQEWGFADDRGAAVVPVLRAGVFADLPERLRSYHAVDGRPPKTVESVVIDLVRILSEPVEPLGTCHRIPRQPAREFSRPELLERVALALGADKQRPEDASRAARAAALYGPSGVGKSTIAAAFARSTRTRRSFRDGIVWVACGPTFQSLVGAREVLTQIAVGSPLPSAEGEIQSTLANGLGRKEILLILDDVRDPVAVVPFVSALGAGGRALLTTFDQAVATALGAAEIPVDHLDHDDARHLLESWAGAPLPNEAEVVLAACDGLPFALAIVGAMVHNRVPWSRVVQALEARRLDLLKAQFPGYPHPNVLRALAASYDALCVDEPAAAGCYLEMAAFRPRAALTESVIVRLWSRPGRLTPLEAALVVPVLERRLLLHQLDGPDGERFILHGLHEDFVRLTCPNASELEAALVNTYRVEKGAADWSSLVDDGYVYDHLIAHLASLGDRDDLVAALNADWVHVQVLRRGDFGQALDDVRLALNVSAQPPIDIPSIARLSVLFGQLTVKLNGAPALLVGALAAIGDVNQALRWAADKPDPAGRFAALVAVAAALVRRKELALARKVVVTAAGTIPLLGGIVETGLFTGLTALNAVHILVDFPSPDEWEGTTEELVAQARAPVDALVQLAPLARDTAALRELAAVRHPFWEQYGHLIPLVAAEQLANRGDPALASALLHEVPEDDNYEHEDLTNAARYRRAVAWAAVGRFEEARAAIDTLHLSYRPVGYRGLARHLAARGQVDQALDLVGLIDDDTVAEQATNDLMEVIIERAEPKDCQRLSKFMLDHDRTVDAACLTAAGGDPNPGLDLLDRTQSDDTGVAIGVRLGNILLRRGQMVQATDVSKRLVPMAERLLGAQWYAPESTGATPGLGHGILSLVARTGLPLPEGVTGLALVLEKQWAQLPAFKLALITDLARAGRFEEALHLADVSWFPIGRVLGVAEAIAAAGPSIRAEQREAAAVRLNEALDVVSPTLKEASPSGELDYSLGSAVQAFISGGFYREADRLVQQLLLAPGLGRAIGVWALHGALTGRVSDVHELVRRLLVEQPFTLPDAWARAMVLSAVASRRLRPGAELAAAGTLLTDVGLAARTLDLVFEVVDLRAQQEGLDIAGPFARSVPSGPAAELAEKLLSSAATQWDDEKFKQEVAAAAGVRAVAAASMAIATSRLGPRSEALKWLKRAEDLASVADRVASYLGVTTAIAKYLGAARAELTDVMPEADDAELVRATTCVLWDRGRTTRAVRFAERALERWNGLNGLMTGMPAFMTLNHLNRRAGLTAALRSTCFAVVAMDTAGKGNFARAKASATAACAETKSYGWVDLTLSEQSEIRAGVAIAFQRAGEGDAAIEQLREAIEPAVKLARRGELAPFGRLCQALTEVLPPERATITWADWLIAAAEAGANEAIALIAAYARCLPEAALASVIVEPQSGRLLSGA